jgi:hypothetical protein
MSLKATPMTVSVTPDSNLEYGLTEIDAVSRVESSSSPEVHSATDNSVGWTTWPVFLRMLRATVNGSIIAMKCP